jgi:hypothetical protein
MNKNTWRKAILLYSSLILGLSQLVHGAQSEPVSIEQDSIKAPGATSKSVLPEPTSEFQELRSAAFKGILLAIPVLMCIVVVKASMVGMKLFERRFFPGASTLLNNAPPRSLRPADRLKYWLLGQSVQEVVFNGQPQGYIVHKKGLGVFF